MAALPLVSAIIPVHDGDRFVGDAIRSVLEHDYAPLEVIAVDDGSSDGSAAIVRSFRQVRYLHQPNAGVAAARNAGLAAARGDLIAFLDQDDRWLPGKLAAQVARLCERPELGFVLACERMVLEADTPPPSWLPSHAFGRNLPNLVPGVFVGRRRVFDLVGGYDTSFVNASDTDWLYRAKDLGVLYEIMPTAVLLRRIHRANASHDHELSRAEVFRALRASVLRRRKQ